MNRKLTDDDIEITWKALVAEQGPVSGRQLRETLRQRFGSRGSTTRVFELWRRFNEEQRAERSSQPALLRRIGELEQQLAEALKLKDAALKRALLAEEREVVHQDRWANEIYELRQTVQRLQSKRLPM